MHFEIKKKLKVARPALGAALLLTAFQLRAMAQFAAAPQNTPQNNPAVTIEYRQDAGRGMRAYQENTDIASPDILHKSSFQAGKDILVTAADELNREAQTLMSGWAGATPAQRAYIEGAVIAGTQRSQLYARQLGKQLGVTVVDSTLNPSYFELSADPDQVKKLLTDSAAIIMTIENSVPQDKKESAFGKFMGGSVADKLPVLNIFAMHKKGQNSLNQAPIQTAKALASDLLSTADREAKFLPDAQAETSK